MIFVDKTNMTRWIFVCFSFILVVFIVYHILQIFVVFKNDERTKMEIWAKALEQLNKADENTDVDLLLLVIKNNTSIPIIKTDEKDEILDMINVDASLLGNKEKSLTLLNDFKNENTPIKLSIDQKRYQLLYYGNSPVVNKLKYYPLILSLIILLFIVIVYNFYSANKSASENNLWVGMAKETAHQIGTPLSSLIGWLEIMRAEGVDETYLQEIQNDINRLQVITNRFSRIGSVPVLEVLDIVKETQETVEYLRKRTSSQIEFTFRAPNRSVPISLNSSLHSWTIENLVKNAIDAMKGKGKLSIIISENSGYVRINVSDSGSGISKSNFKNVFEPGFTTKKRGWGLGLSLTKRIVEEYHFGRIRVLNSEIGKGTTMQISYRKNETV